MIATATIVLIFEVPQLSLLVKIIFIFLVTATISYWLIKKYITNFQDHISSLENESIDTDLEETKPVKTETSKKEKNNEQK